MRKLEKLLGILDKEKYTIGFMCLLAFSILGYGRLGTAEIDKALILSFIGTALLAIHSATSR